MAKIDTPVITKTSENLTLWAAHTCMAYVRD